MEPRKYWTRFTLLTLIPIGIGIIIGLVVVRLGHKNCKDQALLEECSINLTQANDKASMVKVLIQKEKDFHEFPKTAQRELEKLAIDLNKLHQYNTSTTIDSIINSAIQKITASCPRGGGESSSTKTVEYLLSYFHDKAINLGWEAKAYFRGQSTDQMENEYIRSLELELEARSANLKRVELVVDNRDGEINDLRNQLQSEEKLPCPTQECDHENCMTDLQTELEELKATKAKLDTLRTTQTMLFIADLQELKNTTSWIGDKKLRKQLESMIAKYNKTLEKIKQEKLKTTPNNYSNSN